MPKKNEPSTSVATKDAPPPVTLLPEGFDEGELAGAGAEMLEVTDYAIPFLTLLQTNSPQAKEDKDTYVSGAKAGMIFDTVNQILYDGKGGVEVVIAYITSPIIEWVPRGRGGGFVKAHETSAEKNAVRAKTQEKIIQTDAGEKRVKVLPNGNEVVDTIMFYCLMVQPDDIMPCIISCSSTKMTPARQVNSKIQKQAYINSAGQRVKPAPTFFRTWRFKTFLDGNNLGDYYNFVTAPGQQIINFDPKFDGELHPMSQELSAAAIKFMQDIKSGKAVMNEESLNASEGVGTSDSGSNNY